MDEEEEERRARKAKSRNGRHPVAEGLSRVPISKRERELDGKERMVGKRDCEALYTIKRTNFLIEREPVPIHVYIVYAYIYR